MKAFEGRRGFKGSFCYIHQISPTMIFREATLEDIPDIQLVRNSVKENILSDPTRVTNHDVAHYLTNRGKGWVCDNKGEIVGFAIADLEENNIWALFIKPEYEGFGIGKALQLKMLDWYFSCGKDHLWLSTEPGTRAERFYRRSGWEHTGKHGDYELKFEMTRGKWEQIKKANS